MLHDDFSVSGEVQRLALPLMRYKAFWENLSVLQFLSLNSPLSLIGPLIRPAVQSEHAQAFSHSDSLSRLQVEAEVFGSFEQQNDGGAKVELPESRSFLQGYACCPGRGHAPITCAVQKRLPCANVASVEESAFGVAWSVGLELLDGGRAE